MLGGIDPKQMNAMMKKMGIKTETISAKEVVIKGERNIVIKEPQVTVIEAQGTKTFQISGRIEEEKKAEGTAEDVEMVMEQSGANEDDAKRALEETNGDIAEAIMKLKGD